MTVSSANTHDVDGIFSGTSLMTDSETPQLEGGALGSAAIAGGVNMKFLAIWFYRNRSMAKGASEDRLAHFVDLLEAHTGVHRDCLPAAMDDWVG